MTCLSFGLDPQSQGSMICFLGSKAHCLHCMASLPALLRKPYTSMKCVLWPRRGIYCLSPLLRIQIPRLLCSDLSVLLSKSLLVGLYGVPPSAKVKSFERFRPLLYVWTGRRVITTKSTPFESVPQSYGTIWRAMYLSTSRILFSYYRLSSFSKSQFLYSTCLCLSVCLDSHNTHSKTIRSQHFMPDFLSSCYITLCLGEKNRSCCPDMLVCVYLCPK